MKKFVIASMVAIAMLVGIQPVFAEQFIAPEVSTSDSQCFVLDLPAGATAEAPECVAPWQMPEVTEVQKVQGSVTQLSWPVDLSNYPSSQWKSYNSNYGAKFSFSGSRYSCVICISDANGAAINVEGYANANYTSMVDFSSFPSASGTAVYYRIDFGASVKSIHVYPTGNSSGGMSVYY